MIPTLKTSFVCAFARPVHSGRLKALGQISKDGSTKARQTLPEKWDNHRLTALTHKPKPAHHLPRQECVLFPLNKIAPADFRDNILTIKDASRTISGRCVLRRDLKGILVMRLASSSSSRPSATIRLQYRQRRSSAGGGFRILFKGRQLTGRAVPSSRSESAHFEQQI